MKTTAPFGPVNYKNHLWMALKKNCLFHSEQTNLEQH